MCHQWRDHKQASDWIKFVYSLQGSLQIAPNFVALTKPAGCGRGQGRGQQLMVRIYIHFAITHILRLSHILLWSTALTSSWTSLDSLPATMAFTWLIPRKKGTSPTKGACLGMHISIFVFILLQLHGYSAQRALRGHVLNCLIWHVWADHGNNTIILIHLWGLTNRV